LKSFWDGFEKRAYSLVGSMPGVTSGLRRYKKKGEIAQAHPKSGITIGPRSSSPGIALSKAVGKTNNPSVSHATPYMTQGVSSMTI